jgi:excisionase family DNA binding protein
MWLGLNGLIGFSPGSLNRSFDHIHMDIKKYGGDNLLTSEEVAALLRVTPETVVLLAKAGKIDAIRFGHAWRFRRDSLEAYLDSTSTQSQKPS